MGKNILSQIMVYIIGSMWKTTITSTLITIYQNHMQLKCFQNFSSLFQTARLKKKKKDTEDMLTFSLHKVVPFFHWSDLIVWPIIYFVLESNTRLWQIRKLQKVLILFPQWSRRFRVKSLMNRFKGMALRKIPVSDFFQMISVLSESQEYL